MNKCLHTALISKVFVQQGRGCAQTAGNFKGFLKLINFLFFELFKVGKICFERLCVFIEPSGTNHNAKQNRRELIESPSWTIYFASGKRQEI